MPKAVKLHEVYRQRFVNLGGELTLAAADTEYFSKPFDVFGTNSVMLYCKIVKGSNATRYKLKLVYHIDPDAAETEWHTYLTKGPDVSGKAIVALRDELQMSVPDTAGTYYWAVEFEPGKRHTWARTSTERNGTTGSDTIEWYWQTSASGIPGDSPSNKWGRHNGTEPPPDTGGGNGGLDGGDIDG